MKKNKLTALALTAAVALSALAGCGSDAPAPSSAPEPAPSPEASASAESSGSESAAENTASGHSWEQDTSDCTVTWFMAYDWYGKQFDEVNNAFDKKLYEKTGMKLEIETGDTDKLNMLIQTGNLPDIITLDANSSQRKLLEESGMVQPLDTLRDEYAPDLEVPQSMIDWYTAPDGHWYSIASFYYGDDNIAQNNGYYETHNQNFVRDDILKEIGMTDA